jgi:FKBP-type peptidyl-prolyl cis-trans isomerase
MKNKSIIVSLIIVVCFVIIVFLIIKNTNRENTLEDNSQQPVVGTATVNVTPDATQLQTQEAPNTSTSMDQTQTAKVGDTLVMNYTGRLTDGTVFDSNVDPKFGHVQPFEFTLGAGQVIAGWDEGLVGMKVGEKKTLTVPPEKAYGSKANGPIPANSTLIFDVELVAIK